MLAAVMIVFVVVLPNGTLDARHEERRGIDACWAEAKRYVMQDPAKFGGVALGSGCIVAGQKS